MQSLREIMANKLVAFPVSVQGRHRPRYRDIWDLRWLARRNVQPDLTMISAKAIEHGVEGFEDCLETTIPRMDDIVGSAGFLGEMSRFLPSDVRDRSLDREDWREETARTLRNMMEEVLSGLRGEPRANDFEF